MRITLSGAMRARDVSRPTDEQLAAAAEREARMTRVGRANGAGGPREAGAPSRGTGLTGAKPVGARSTEAGVSSVTAPDRPAPSPSVPLVSPAAPTAETVSTRGDGGTRRDGARGEAGAGGEARSRTRRRRRRNGS
jgi:hypothetical protein